MIKKILAITTLALGSASAMAALTTLDPWQNSAYIQGRGLSGVLFNAAGVVPASSTAPATAFVALGAHPYVNGVTMANDGISTFYAPTGLSPSAPAGQTRANWSFDFAFNLGDCDDCQVQLRIDNPADVGNVFTFNIVDNETDINAGGGTWLESWNLEMAHLAGFSFDPNQRNTVTNFELVILNATGGTVLSTAITVEAVPEPGSLALVGLALAGLGFARRRKA